MKWGDIAAIGVVSVCIPLPFDERVAGGRRQMEHVGFFSFFRRTGNLGFRFCAVSTLRRIWVPFRTVTVYDDWLSINKAIQTCQSKFSALARRFGSGPRCSVEKWMKVATVAEAIRSNMDVGWGRINHIHLGKSQYHQTGSGMKIATVSRKWLEREFDLFPEGHHVQAYSFWSVCC